jgi:hypothetical protein
MQNLRTEFSDACWLRQQGADLGLEFLEILELAVRE